MPKGLHIRIDNIEKLRKAMQARANGLDKKIDAIMDGTVLDINRDQVIATPVDNGVLKRGNRFDISKPLSKSIFNITEYVPYVEFGTGGMVNVPARLEEIAGQFKGKGIRKVNLPARPFFYPAFFAHKKKMIEKIKKALIEKP